MERTEAIEVIRKCWPVNRNGMLSDALETLIPELKESEDERVRKEIYNFLIDMECKKEWIAYLEKQKEQKSSTPEDIAAAYQMGLAKGRNEQKPAEWSEEDEKMRNNLIELLIRLSAKTRTDSTSINYSYPREIDWLKSLRPDSYKNCNSRWKPSEEQMKCLDDCVNRAREIYNASTSGYDAYHTLRSLYHDLQNLH